MPDINFSTGLVPYNINGVCEVLFNPTDSAFVERLFNTFYELDKKQDEYKAEVDGLTDKKQIFEVARERDAEMRRMVDGVFDAPVCDALFGKMNVYAMADGLPVWCNLMLSVMDEIDTSFAKEQKQTIARIAKYTAKYQSRIKK